MKRLKGSKVMLSTLVATGVLFFSMIAQAAMNEASAPIVETQVSTKGETQIELPSSAFFFTADIETNQELVEKVLEESKAVEAERKAELERLRIIEEERKKLEDAEIAQKKEIERQIKLRELEEKRVAEEKAREAEKKRVVDEKKVQATKSESKTNGGNTMTFEATYYTPYCFQCSGVTKAGVDVRKSIYYNGMRIVATDNNVIPLWSIIEVSSKNGTFTAIALDSGGAIKNRKLDILVADKKTAYSLGRHSVQVKIIRKGK